MRVDERDVGARTGRRITRATRHSEAKRPRIPSQRAQAARVDSDQQEGRSQQLGALVRSRRTSGRRQHRVGLRTRRVGEPRIHDINRRGVGELERDAFGKRAFGDRERNVRAATTTRLGSITFATVATIVVAVIVLVRAATDFHLVVILAAGARGMHELDAAVAMWSAANHEEARKAQAEHEQDRPDRDLEDLTRHLTS